MQVVHAVLQVINQLAKDNPNFQENACLVGLVRTLLLVKLSASIFNHKNKRFYFILLLMLFEIAIFRFQLL